MPALVMSLDRAGRASTINHGEGRRTRRTLWNFRQDREGDVEEAVEESHSLIYPRNIVF
jgi:hypothetical protein